MTEEICPTCGTNWGPNNNDHPPIADRCSACPPRVCADCGEPDDRECSCWVSLEGMAHADLKAIFAQGGLSISRDI